jgi:tRNA A37 N6-isopentenylltransferase MiaA
MVNIDVGDIFGPYTGHDAKRLEDEWRGSPLQDRAAARFTSEVKQRLQGHLNDRLRAADTELHERWEVLDDQAIELKEATQKVVRRLKSGRLTAAEARKEIARIGTAKRELSERAEQLRHDDDSLQAMAEMDPADYEQEYLATTPALRRQLPVLTAAYLNQP